MKTMKPMLAESVDTTALPTFMLNDDWYVQQKLDGDRLLICVNDGKVTALNRAGEQRRNSVPRKLLDQFRNLPGQWCFDGELMEDAFWVFDLPRALDSVGPEHPLQFRLDILSAIFDKWRPDTWVRVLPTARTKPDKAKLLREVLNGGGEGVVLKDRNGRYRPGARSRSMLKFKLVKTADAIVTAVGVEGKANCHYSMFDDGHLVEVGSCSTLGRSPVKVGDVIELRYLYASDDRHLYQPVLLKVRDDKAPEECTIDQLVYTNRAVVEFRPEKAGSYVRQRRPNRRTGTTVAIFDTRHPDNVFDADGGRWVTFCEKHGLLVNHETLGLARRFATTPDVWCENCKEMVK